MRNKPLVAYFDDDEANLSAYQDFLADEFEIQLFQKPEKLVQALEETKFDCFLLDIRLAGSNAFDLVEYIRQSNVYRSTPIFFITGSPEDFDKLEILRLGVADVFDRFIHRDELVVRLQSKISAYREFSSLIKIGSLVLDRAKLDCRLNGHRITLTLLEFKILAKLASDYPRAISRDVLIQYVWGGDSVSTNSLNTHISNLRSKLSGWGFEISYDKALGFFFKEISE